MLCVSSEFSSESDVVLLLEPCNFLLMDLALSTAKGSAPDIAKLFTILVASGFRSAKALLRSLVALSNEVLVLATACNLDCDVVYKFSNSARVSLGLVGL